MYAADARAGRKIARQGRFNVIGDKSGDVVYKGVIARDNESLATRTRERDIACVWPTWTYI